MELGVTLIEQSCQEVPVSDLIPLPFAVDVYFLAITSEFILELFW